MEVLLKPITVEVRFVNHIPRTADMQDMVDRIDQRIFEDTGVRRAAISFDYNEWVRQLTRQMAKAMGVSADMLRSRR